MGVNVPGFAEARTIDFDQGLVAPLGIGGVETRLRTRPAGGRRGSRVGGWCCASAPSPRVASSTSSTVFHGPLRAGRKISSACSAVHRLGEKRVIEAVPDRSDRRARADPASRSP